MLESLRKQKLEEEKVISLTNEFIIFHGELAKTIKTLLESDKVNPKFNFSNGDCEICFDTKNGYCVKYLTIDNYGRKENISIYDGVISGQSMLYNAVFSQDGSHLIGGVNINNSWVAVPTLRKYQSKEAPYPYFNGTDEELAELKHLKEIVNQFNSFSNQK